MKTPVKQPAVKILGRKLPFKQIFIAGAVLISVTLAARPTYHFLKEKQIDANLISAETAARQKNWESSRDLARSVLIARPSNFDAFLIWSKAVMALKGPAAYMAAAQLFVHKKTLLSDKLKAFRFLCADAPQAVALSAYGSLPQEIRDSTDFRAEMSTFLLRRGELISAAGILRSDPKLKSNPRGCLALVRILCALPTKERIQEARELSASMMSVDAPELLDAVLLLAKISEGLAPTSPLEGLQEWVLKNPAAETRHRLCVMQSTILANPELAETVYDHAANLFLENDPAALGTWLISQGRADKAAALLKFAAKENAEAYIVHLRALQKEKLTAELDTDLAAPPLSADRVEIELIRAALAHERKDIGAEKTAWDRVFNEAVFDHKNNRFLDITRFATILGATDTADNAAVAALRVGWGPIPLYQDFRPIFARMARQNRTGEMMSMYRVLLRFEPNNAELQNNFLYLGLLHNIIPPQDAVQRLEALQKSDPHQQGLSSSLAFAYLLNNEPDRALTILNGVEEGILKEALHGTALLGTGQTDAARQILLKIFWPKLLNQEAIVFRDVIMQSAVSDIPLVELKPLLSPQDSAPPPAWMRAIEAMEKARAGDVLPTLPPLQIPKYIERK